MTMTVYVAAPFLLGGVVRAMHESMDGMGIRPTSRWAEHAIGVEDFAKYTPAQLRAFAIQNDEDIAAADVTLLYDPTGIGRETYADARLALALERTVAWCSPRGISQYREGVVRVPSCDLHDALFVLESLRRNHAEGLRGRLLALSSAADAPFTSEKTA